MLLMIEKRLVQGNNSIDQYSWPFAGLLEWHKVERRVVIPIAVTIAIASLIAEPNTLDLGLLLKII